MSSGKNDTAPAKGNDNVNGQIELESFGAALNQ
jgi:hypothetical protein